MWTEVTHRPFTGEYLVVNFHDEVWKPWDEAAQSIIELGFAKTDDEKKRRTQDAIRNVVATVTKAQHQASGRAECSRRLETGGLAQDYRTEYGMGRNYSFGDSNRRTQTYRRRGGRT